jgi:hypothetical protein
VVASVAVDEYREVGGVEEIDEDEILAAEWRGRWDEY